VEKVALANSTPDTRKEPRLRDRIDTAWFMTSGQETERVYSYNPGSCTGRPWRTLTSITDCCVVDITVMKAMRLATAHMTHLSHLTNHESHLYHVIMAAVTSHSRPTMTSHAANTSK